MKRSFPTRGGEGLQVKGLAGELEDKIASDHVGFLTSVSERYEDGFLLRGGRKLCGDAVGEVAGKPGRSGKGFEEWALGIAQEQREFIAERTDAELEIAETDAIGWHGRRHRLRKQRRPPEAAGGCCVWDKQCDI